MVVEEEEAAEVNEEVVEVEEEVLKIKVIGVKESVEVE